MQPWREAMHDVISMDSVFPCFTNRWRVEVLRILLERSKVDLIIHLKPELPLKCIDLCNYEIVRAAKHGLNILVYTDAEVPNWLSKHCTVIKESVDVDFLLADGKRVWHATGIQHTFSQIIQIYILN